MSSGGVEEVGARLLIEGGAVFRDELAAAREAIVATDDALDHFAATSRRAGKVVATAQDATVAALDRSDEAMTAATDRLAAFNAEQARTAEVSKVSAASVARSQKVMVDAMAGGAAAGGSRVIAGTGATWKKAVAASTKIVKWGMLGVTAIAYEGIKNWMSFQQMVSQGAIDAGLKASQLPALEKGFLAISNATGVAAGGVNGVADAAYRLASAYPGLHLTTKELLLATKNAANLGVLAGQTGNMDTISRMYGALIANGMWTKNGSKPLTYSSSSLKAVNEWALAVTGHGDVKMGDLISALGTGVLPMARTFGLSLNQMGAAFDVLAPAMNASSAATRLKTALGMLAAPSQKASQAFELIGGNVTTAGSILRTKGLGGLLNYLATRFANPVTGKTFYGQFYGGGLGSFATTPGGKAKGAIAYMQALGFTPAEIQVLVTKGARGFLGMTPAQLQAIGFAPGTTGQKAMQTFEAAILAGAFGGGRTGAAILQLVNERGVYQKKLVAIGGAETPTAYKTALRLAYAQPMRQWDIFWTRMKNMTISVGKDITPAFDDFLHTLERIGHWFNQNRWALDSLLGAAGTVFAGAAAIKTASMVNNAFRGGAAILRVATTPISQWRTLITGGGALDGAAAKLTASAVSLDEAALALKGASGTGLPGVPRGGVPTPIGGAAGDAASTAERDALEGGAGAGAVGVLGRLRGVVRSFDMVDAAAAVGAYEIAKHTLAIPERTRLAMGRRLPKWSTLSFIPGATSAAKGANDAMRFLFQTGPHDVVHGIESLWHWATHPSAAALHRYSVNTRTSSALLPAGITAAQAKQIQSLVTAGATLPYAVKLERLVSQIAALEHSHDSTSAKEHEAAQLAYEAAQLQKQAAQQWASIPPALAAALSSGAIHRAATTGLRHRVARK